MSWPLAAFLSIVLNVIAVGAGIDGSNGGNVGAILPMKLAVEILRPANGSSIPSTPVRCTSRLAAHLYT